MTPAYESTVRLEAARGAGVWLTIAGAVALFFLGGQLFVWDDPSWALIDISVLAAGVTLLLWSRARLKLQWEANKPFLLGDEGASVMRGRNETSARLSRTSHLVLALFLVCGVAFFFLFSAIACGDRVDGFCGDVGRPPEWFVELWQTVTIAIGAAYVGVVSMRRRFDDETERIDVVVAEGQRRRRHDHPMDGTDRFSWE